jgi:hypothetical protein
MIGVKIGRMKPFVQWGIIFCSYFLKQVWCHARSGDEIGDRPTPTAKRVR